MKVLQRELNKQFAQKLISSRFVKVAARNIIYFLVAIFVSRGRLFNEYLPYGISFLAAVPYNSMWFVVFGTIISYILPSEINIGMRYIATAVAVCAIRWTLNDLKKLKEHVLFSPILAVVAVATTGFVINKNVMSDLSLVVIYLTEAVLAGITTYFFKETLEITEKNGRIGLTQVELSYFCLSFFIIILSFSEITLWYLSIGRIASMVVILFCSGYFGAMGGSIAGVAAGAALGLSFKNPTYIPMAYSFGGLISGVVSGFGKSICAAGFFIVNIIVSAQSDNPAVILTCVYESLVACIIFMFLPDYIGNRVLSIFYCSADSSMRSSYLKDDITMRLNFTAAALMNISETINKVSLKLSAINSQDISSVYLKSIDSVCNNCGLRVFCYEAKRTDTIASFEYVTNILKSDGEVEVKNFRKDFIKRCCKIDDISKSINMHYKDYMVQAMAKQRIDEARGFVSEQFLDVGKILWDISKDLETYDTFDLESAKRISEMFKNYDIVPANISCRINKLNRMTVEIDIIEKEKSSIEKISLQSEISKCCARAMEKPSVVRVEEKCKIKLSEEPCFKVRVGVAQHNYKNEALCGDSYQYFNDGMGKINFILSDGMGTGGRAAIEGTMACEIMKTLIKSGVNFETAARLTNSALIVKSEDEFLATLDIMCIDLFTGKARFLKAGAPFTLIKKNGKIVRIDLPSLPIGILKNIEFNVGSENLGKKDKVLMFSDGALYKEDWIETELQEWDDEPAEVFAQRMVDKATKIRENNSDDDITVIAVDLTN